MDISIFCINFALVKLKQTNLITLIFLIMTTNKANSNESANNVNNATANTGKNAKKKAAKAAIKKQNADELTKKAALGGYKANRNAIGAQNASLKKDRRSLMQTLKYITTSDTTEAKTWRDYFNFKKGAGKDELKAYAEQIAARYPWKTPRVFVKVEHDSKGNEVTTETQAGYLPIFLGTKNGAPTWKERTDHLDVLRDIQLFELAKNTRTNIEAKINEIKAEGNLSKLAEKRIMKLEEELQKLPAESYTETNPEMFIYIKQ